MIIMIVTINDAIDGKNRKIYGYLCNCIDFSPLP